MTQLQIQTYRGHIFDLVYCLMFTLCLNNKFGSFLKIFDSFSPVVDYNCHCFKILNSSYLRSVEAKENYVSKHFQDKDFDVKKINNIWLVGVDKLKKYRAVIVID